MQWTCSSFCPKVVQGSGEIGLALEQVPVENQSARASLEERIAHIKEVLNVSK